MLALAITVSALVLIALLRFGVIAEYSEEGLKVWVTAGFFKFRLLDDHKKSKPKKPKKPKNKKSQHLEMKPGSLSEFMGILKAVLNALGRLKRRLLIKQLTLYYTSAGENPVNTALQFGAANAVSGSIIPQIKKNFRVRRLDFKTGFDFTSTEQMIYAKIIISIAVWEVFYALFALMPLIKPMFKKRPAKDSVKDNIKEDAVKEETGTKDNIDRKDGQDNGKSAD